ncbi:hypothetical protein H2200_005441 [Cladophialophora chaetospira]|uniref:Zn(2)-C6 fungal-type domain-containing protein n=1 Tax=Cladophialophora chaetospira TaxID=386627 RepID=A0AA39CIX7_9EURO|nr:hypothetical protein H2200_005441 [Cladophialophora chaetospira]
MPRPKPLERRRCQKACEICKRKKEKCDGLAPCSLCKKRRIEERCVYVGGRSSVHAQASPRVRVQSNDIQIRSSSIQDTLEQTWLSPTGDDGEGSETPVGAVEAPVPKDARLVTDATGQYVYLGDSASPSFLHNVRLIVATAMGPCDFTTDSNQHRIVEAGPEPDDFSPHWPQSLGPIEAIELALQYRIAVSGALDLFDHQALDQSIQKFAKDPARSCWPNAASLYLVLALGAQARAANQLDDMVGQTCFVLGRDLAMAGLKATPDIFMVQACCMIAWYLLTASRRSIATMYLGLAAQAAYSIGIHRQEANATFRDEDRKVRERVWKTLRVCDIFLSATMGRPSTTSHVACNVDLDASANIHKNGAESISERHRKWTVDFSETSKADSLSASADRGVDPAIFFGSSTLLMAYHYSIILLTRPFLTLHVKTCVDQRSSQMPARRDHMDVMTYSDACVSSALKMIDLAHEFASKPLSPNRSPLQLNSTFISALSLGLAYFGNYKSTEWPLEAALTKATTILKRLGSHSLQAARHSEIIGKLWDAAKRYELFYKDNTMRIRNQRVSKMFGDISVGKDSGVRPAFLNSDTATANGGMVTENSSHPRFDQPGFLVGSDMEAFGAMGAGRDHLAQPAPSVPGPDASIESSTKCYLYSDPGGQPDFFADTTPTDLIDFTFHDQAPLFYLPSDDWAQGQS